MLWLWTVLLGPLAESPAEGKSPTEVMGILGGSATFLLGSPRPLDRVFWFKDDVQVAFLRAGAPCEVYLLGALAGREVTVSQDCRSFTLGALRGEDSARYRARTPDPAGLHEVGAFDLKVYRNSAKGKAPQEVIGMLGESATLTLESPRPFALVFWYRNGAGLASLRPEPPPCHFRLAEAHASWDVTVSQDCRTLAVRGLRQEDSAGYRALTLSKDEVVADQTFILKVYKRLSEADLEVVCAKEVHKDGNETWHLNCSAGQWEDGVEFSWASPTQAGAAAFLERSPVLRYEPQEDDLDLTCSAENPVGSTSRTVSLKQACAPGTMDSSSRLSSEVALGVAIATVVVAKMIIAACFLAKWLPCTKEGELQGAWPCSA